MTPHHAHNTVAVRPRAVLQPTSTVSTPDLLGEVLYIHGSLRHRPVVRERLARLGPQLTIASDIADGMRLVIERRFELILIDLADDRGALASIRMLRAVHPNLPLAGIVDPTSPATAAEALRAGLTELMPWPFDARDVMVIIANTRDRLAIGTDQLPARGATGGLFAQSPVMRPVLDAVRGAAATRRGLFVVGETGTGRELVARAIHAQSAGRTHAFVSVDCASSPAELEQKLFGTLLERAEDAQPVETERLSAASALYHANGGTLFLSNLTEAPARIQMRLARVLRDREASVGDAGSVTELDVRTIAAVDPDIDVAVEDGRLRRELFDRFPLSRLDVPPLRGRRDDIPLLSVHFANEICDTLNVPAKSFSRAALALLSALPWHGNAHELHDLVEALVPRRHAFGDSTR